MFKIKIIFLFAVFLILAACTGTPEPAADPVVVQRPTITATSTNLPSTETPTPTAEATMTTIPRLTPTAYTPLPTDAATLPPQSAYENIWAGGLLMSQTELWVANSSIPNVLFQNPKVPLETADPETAEHLNSLPHPWVLVMVQGDYYYNGPEDNQLVVESIELVNLPYSAETPLDATYHHAEPDFTFDYPTGWFINPIDDDTDVILHLHNAPPIVFEQQLGIGTEYSDPTRYDLTVSVLDVASSEAYIKTLEEIDPELWDLEMVELNGHSVPKITSYGFGSTVTYLVEINGTVLSFLDWLPDTDFMERIIATVR